MATSVAPKKQEVININDLPAPYLNKLNEQMEEEIKFLSESIQQLKYLQGQFQKAKDTLKAYIPENENKEILVPFSSTLYVPGKMKKVTTVRIDVGTGYFIDVVCLWRLYHQFWSDSFKTIDQAKSYYDRRSEYIEKQIEKVRPSLNEKTEMKKKVAEILTLKINEMIKNSKIEGSPVKAWRIAADFGGDCWYLSLGINEFLISLRPSGNIDDLLAIVRNIDEAGVGCGVFHLLCNVDDLLAIVRNIDTIGVSCGSFKLRCNIDDLLAISRNI